MCGRDHTGLFYGQRIKNNLKAQRHFAKHKSTSAWVKVRNLVAEGTPLCTCVSDFRPRVLLLGADQGAIIAALREILSINGIPWPHADAVSHLPQFVFISDHRVRFRACAPISRVQLAFFVHARDASPTVLVQVCLLLCVRRLIGCSSVVGSFGDTVLFGVSSFAGNVLACGL